MGTAFTRNKNTWFGGTETWNPIGGSPQFAFTKAICYNHVIGENQPRFRQIIKNHENAFTQLSGEYTGVNVSTPLKVRCRSSNQGNQDASGHTAFRYLGTPGFPTLSPNQAREKATQTFLKNVRKARTQISGQVFLGELRESLHMLRRPGEALARALSDTYLQKLKRLKKKNPKGWEKAIFGTWLECAFGWLPLLNDLKDAHKAYNELVNSKADRTVNVRGFGQISDPSTVAGLQRGGIGGVFAGQNAQYTYQRNVTENAFCVYRGQVRGLADRSASSMVEALGLHPREFVPTLWELLPWSFLVDYFTNIGNLLEAHTTDTTNLVWWGRSTVSYRRYDSYVAFNRARTAVSNFNLDAIDYVGPSRCISYAKKIVREPAPPLSIGPLRFELPGSPAQWANMSALWGNANINLHRQRPPRHW